MKESGTIKFFNDTKGFGFINADNGENVFVHKSALNNTITTLNENDRVVFDIEKGDRGPKAVNVSFEEKKEGTKTEDIKSEEDSEEKTEE